jgi:hypothetical protein
VSGEIAVPGLLFAPPTRVSSFAQSAKQSANYNFPPFAPVAFLITINDANLTVSPTPRQTPA